MLGFVSTIELISLSVCGLVSSEGDIAFCFALGTYMHSPKLSSFRFVLQIRANIRQMIESK